MMIPHYLPFVLLVVTKSVDASDCLQPTDLIQKSCSASDNVGNMQCGTQPSSKIASCNCSSLVMDLRNSTEGNCTQKLNVSVKVCVASSDALKRAAVEEIDETMLLSHNVSWSVPIIHDKMSPGNRVGVTNSSQVEILPHEGDTHNPYFIATTANIEPENRSVELANQNLTEDFTKAFIGSSDVTFIIVYDDDFNEVQKPIRLFVDTKNTRFPGTGMIKELKKVCMFYNMTLSKWDDSVCSTAYTDDSDSVTCTCHHNSAFAVVFLVRETEIPEAIFVFSGIAGSLSVAFLLVTTVLLVIHRQRMRYFDRVLVQINLCSALLFMHLFFVVGQAARKSEAGCTAVMFFSHVFILSSAVLMVLEGVLMLTKVLAPTIAGEGVEAKKRRIVGFLLAWVFPFVYAGVFCIVCMATGRKTSYPPKYANGRMQGKNGELYEQCWFQLDLAIYAVLIPVALALLINLFITARLGILVWTVSKSSEEFKPSHMRDHNKHKHANKAFRAVFFLLPVLGLPWILGYLVNIEGAEVPFAAIHIVINGLQGLLIFLHYTIFSSEMKTVLRRSWQTISDSIIPSVHFVSSSNVVENVTT